MAAFGISFLLHCQCFTDFISTMALLEVSEANCTAIDTAITIRKDSISLCINNRFAFIPGICDTYYRLLNSVHVFNQIFCW